MTTDRHDSEAGFTLIELLVGMAMMLIITLAAVSMFTSVLHRQPESTEAADVIGTARNAAEKITADLREGEGATVSNPSELHLMTPCSEGSGSCEIAYQCGEEVGATTFRCTRASGGTTRTIVTGLSSDQVFCVYPTATAGIECGPQGATGPRYVGIKLEFPSHKGALSTTVLEDGAALHNLPEALVGQ
jgi:prepilin-type N-terminal cleavage/methylation domain-containing protein